MEITVKQIIENTVSTILHPMFENESPANRQERLEFIKFLVMKYDWLPTRTTLDKELLDFGKPEQTNINLQASPVERANAFAKIIGLHENYYETIEEATRAALDRSLFTNRIIYIFSIDDMFMVCTHGVERVGHILVRRCQYGSIL
jgi:hypothetical protein